MPSYSNNKPHLRDCPQISFFLLTQPMKSALGEPPQPNLNNYHSETAHQFYYQDCHLFVFLCLEFESCFISIWFRQH